MMRNRERMLPATLLPLLVVLHVSVINAIPELCLLPPDMGPCKKFDRAYYYSQEDGLCHPFKYGGCPGNENIFWSRQQCVRICIHNGTEESTTTTTTTLSPTSPSGPTQEPSSTTLSYEDRIKSVLQRLPATPHVILENGTGQSTFTFASPSSFIQIGPEGISSYQIRNRRSVSLEFRTRLPHALLVYHGIKNRPTGMLKYELYIMLDQGQLNIKHLFGDYSTTVVVGKGLNKDRWHKVDVMINPHYQQILAIVDDHDEARKKLDGLTEHKMYGAEHEDLESIIFIGGLKASEEHLEVSYVANPFVGCIRNVTLATSPLLSSQLSPITPLISSRFRNVDEDCLDKCWDIRVPCARDSACINHYDHVECDCFSARFKGDSCKSTDISILTLSGYSYVTFTVYEWMDRVHSDVNRISMHFKTYTDDSILFYAAGELPFHNHVALSLRNHRVYVDIKFSEQDAIATHIGSSLTDGHWHILTIEHRERTVTIKLDNHEKQIAIAGNNSHLYIDPDIYIGGGGPILKNRKGLNSTNNFVGCLKEVYFNEKSILFELRQNKHQARHHGLTGPVFGECVLRNTVPITIPFAESGFRITNPKPDELNLRFEFKPEGLYGTLAYSDIRTTKGEGFWELKIVNEEVHFTLQPDKSVANISTPETLIAKFNRRGGSSWNSVELKYNAGTVSLYTDRTTQSGQFDDVLQLSPFITLGTSVQSPYLGFRGCMRRIMMAGSNVDARTIVGSEDQIGDIAMDNCQFVDPCTRPDVCEHGGNCSVKGGEISCECDGSGYIGKHCHFAVFKRTCEELALLGYTESGVYKIDIDGNGPYPPSHVKCKFETDFSGETKTIVEHNLANETDVWVPGEDPQDFKLELSYREFTPEMLMSLVSQSVQCHQHIKFDCFRARLGLHQYTWFKSADMRSRNVISIGDMATGTCPCYETMDGCAGMDERCNCDSMDNRWLSDEGFFSLPDRLGITQMYFMAPKELDKNSAARITLGSLECVEANTQRYVVTFKTFGSYLEAPGWKSGDLAFSFRTTRSSAILLYQPLLHSQDNSFSVYLTNDHELMFRFTLNGGAPQSVTVRSQRALSGGDWQQVWIDYDLHQVRFQINREHQMISLADGQQFGPFEGTMYIAGAPANNSDTEIQDGLIGCFRGLVMNGQVLDLYSYMKFHKADIVKDCSPSCDPNPCKNKATCQENWGSFTCQCQNPYSQSGQFCEHDINEDGLTFLSQSSYVKKALKDVRNSPLKNILTSNIYVNLRTYDTEALVLYANDNLNNFVQLHITEGERMIFSWNYGEMIQQLEVQPNKPLNRGESIQIAVERNETHTTLHVNQDSKSAALPVNLLTQYSDQPFINAELEVFVPPRPYAPVSTYYQMFLAGYDNSALKHASNLTYIPGLLGCLRGLKIGNERFILSGFANSDDVLDGCKMVCDSKPCHNGGMCVEDFTSRTYSCDCQYTSYYGKRCDEERGASFQGESLLRRRFKVPLKTVDEVTAHFGFSTTSDTYGEGHTVLLTVQVPGRKYSLLFAITKAGHFLLKENREGSGTYGTLINYQNFVDSSRHSVFFRRSRVGETLLIVDQEEIDIKPLRDEDEIFSPLAIVGEQDHFIGDVFIGGVSDAVPSLRGFQRFKGCMSNIFVEINDVEMRPLDEYMGFAKKEPDLVLEVDKVEGIKLGNCAAFSSFSVIRSKASGDQDDDMSPLHSGGTDWRSTLPEKLPLHLREQVEVQAATISFNTMALIFAIFFGTILLFLVMYIYRLDKRYKRRILDDDDDDDYHFRPPPVRYPSANGNATYGAYKRQGSQAEALIRNQNSGLNNSAQPKSILSASRQNSTAPKEEEQGIDDENASSSSETSENRSHHSSSSSLSNTEALDDKGDYDAVPKADDGAADGDDDAENIPNEDVRSSSSSRPPASNIDMPPVYLSETVRTFETSPIAIIGGPRYGQFKRNPRPRSIESVLSLD